MPKSLFRTHALQARRHTWLGPIIMVRPPGAALWTVLGVCSAALVVFLLVWGQYTRRATVSGRLVPAAGAVKVYASQPSVVVGRHVAEGQTIPRDLPLFELSNEQLISVGQQTLNVQAMQSRRTQERSASISEQMKRIGHFHEQESVAHRNRLDQLRQRVDQIDQQILVQDQRLQLAREAAQRQDKLVRESFVSQAAVQQAQADLLDQELRLKSLVRERGAALMDVQVQEQAATELHKRQSTELAELTRLRTSTEQEITDHEARRRQVITAPVAGTVTTILAEPGQSVDTARPLLTILPSGTRLQAHLYAPSHAMGFVRIGSLVRLRYPAYPYQKFGQATGSVLEVSQTALSGSDLVELAGMGGIVPNGEPLYRITVALDAQHIRAFAREWPLLAGSAVEADILLESRQLFEWVLEPLLGIRQRLTP